MCIVILAVILFLLMVVVGGVRGIRSYASLLFNFLILGAIAEGMLMGGDPVLVALLGCFLISLITLFFNNGINTKTLSSFLAVVVSVSVIGIPVWMIGSAAKIQGFAYEEFVEIAGYSFNISIDMAGVAVAVILVGLIGAAVDTSISISSCQNEVLRNNPQLSRRHLAQSGMRVGQDIIGTTTNTLFFAYFGSFTTLLVRFLVLQYSFSRVINSSIFCQELIRITLSGLICILVIPVTAMITACFLKNERIQNRMERLSAGVSRWSAGLLDYHSKEDEDGADGEED